MLGHVGASLRVRRLACGGRVSAVVAVALEKVASGVTPGREGARLVTLPRPQRLGWRRDGGGGAPARGPGGGAPAGVVSGEVLSLPVTPPRQGCRPAHGRSAGLRCSCSHWEWCSGAPLPPLPAALPPLPPPPAPHSQVTWFTTDPSAAWAGGHTPDLRRMRPDRQKHAPAAACRLCPSAPPEPASLSRSPCRVPDL